MIFEGNSASEKTEILIKKYTELLNSGVSSNEILVLVQNSTLKNKFIEKTLENLNLHAFEKLQVHSFFSLVYNTICDNWAFLENENPYDNPTILPNLAGLEVSQFILKNILKSVKFKGYNSKKSLLHQLFRRYSLIVQNNLTEYDVQRRSNILGESFADDAKKTLKEFLYKTLYLRDFDYIRQILLFNYIYKNTDYFKNIKYLILDDGDEITPVCFDFIKYLAPQFEDVFIAFDRKGASRAGYLSANRLAVWEYEKIFNEKAVTLKSNAATFEDAENIFINITENKSIPLKHFSMQSPSKRASMLDIAIKKINEMTDKNIPARDIAVVTPVIDEMMQFTLKENLRKNITPVFLSGSEKLISNRLVLSVITILKLNTELKITLSEFDLRAVLGDFLGIPVKYCQKILENFDQNKTFIKQDFLPDEYSEKYKKFLSLSEKLSKSDEKLSEQVFNIYNELAEFTLINKNEITKFNFFIKQLQDFENIFGAEFEQRKTDIITQIENSIIAENPYSAFEVKENDLVIGTPQKIIDNQIKTKYQFWLDISSSEWIKSDTGPLYNAWVFQQGWSKDRYTIEDNIELGKEKTARILRKLTLCAGQKIHAFSSLFDGSGAENFGGIENYIVVPSENEKQKISPAQQIIPRDDQKPVLKYENGRMAISAVPGAGKTTILLALILKLLDKGTNPENIFVLTYMESAARNFRERIKNIRQNSTQLPNISTIHGLALRILKENGNFERMGLPDDFEICDDTQRTRIVREIASALKLKKTETEEFDGCISVFKMSGGAFPEVFTDVKMKKFAAFFENYQNILKGSNLIDYDDMLISSVKLLEENQDILEYYQNICHYIIEDEAQDSSAIQQRLINLLSAKYGNLIRCGDINQAITTTFSNADVEGFRKFISESNNVSMDCSQRCTHDVWELANNLVLWADGKTECKNAFYKIFMHPVAGKNPETPNSIRAEIFENESEEKNFVLKEIKTAFKKNPKTTVGILLRNNYQAARWMSFMNDSGLKTITRSECLEQKTVFKTIFAVMNMILHPFDNNIIADCYETLAEAGFYKQRLGAEIRKYQTPFVTTCCDDIQQMSLAQFYWDLNYWLSFPHLSPDEIALKIGLNRSLSDIEKSNVYLISTLIKRIAAGSKNFASIMERLGELAKKPRLSGFNFFAEEDESDKEFLEGKVQIMTLHKSKGDEFDYVFLPEMSEKNLPLDINQIKLKSSELTENLRRLNPDYKQKSEDDFKREILAENLRLLYVAVTRAKKYLYFTTSTKVKSFGKIITQEPNRIFTEILKEGVKC